MSKYLPEKQLEPLPEVSTDDLAAMINNLANDFDLRFDQIHLLLDEHSAYHSETFKTLQAMQESIHTNQKSIQTMQESILGMQKSIQTILESIDVSQNTMHVMQECTQGMQKSIETLNSNINTFIS